MKDEEHEELWHIQQREVLSKWIFRYNLSEKEKLSRYEIVNMLRFSTVWAGSVMIRALEGSLIKC